MQYNFAPMEGITGAVYRRAHVRHFPGTDRYFMPFLSPSQNHVFTRRELRDILPQYNEGVPAVPQLLTRRAEDFLWAAGELAAMGYREVSLNLGCPSGTVAAKGKGAGFLAFPQELDRFLDEIFSRAPLAVSVKTRLGVHSPEEFPALLEIYNRYPIACLTIHPRVQRDFYKNSVRLDAFAQALRESRNPVCYNGDLVTAADCAALREKFPGVQALMLGRGLAANPALVRQAKGGPGASREELIAFHEALFEGFSAAFGSRRNAMPRMKEIWFYHICLFDGGERYARQLRKAADPRTYALCVSALFRDLPLRTDAFPGWRQVRPPVQAPQSAAALYPLQSDAPADHL